MMNDIAANLHQVRQRIALAAAQAERDPATITLIAVSKTMPITAIASAYAAGVRYFGENRVQEAQSKIPELSLPDAQWEMIGTLQRNKVSQAVSLFGRIQSVDSLALAQEIERVAAQRDQTVPILVQVNVAGEATKHGIAPTDVLTLAQAIAHMPHLRGEGLMTVAPIVADPATVRPIFRQLRELRDQLQASVSPTWRELSMGMSDDFAAAIAEGATLVRIGRAIFGERHQ